MFEMFSSRSKVIVQPTEDLIYLHGARQLDTLEELDPSPISERNGWKLVPSFIEKVLSKPIRFTNLLVFFHGRCHCRSEKA